MSPEVREALQREAHRAPPYVVVLGRSFGAGLMVRVFHADSPAGEGVLVRLDYAPSVRDPRRGRDDSRAKRALREGEFPPPERCVWQVRVSGEGELTQAEDKALRRWAEKARRTHDRRLGRPVWAETALRDLEGGQTSLIGREVISGRPGHELALWEAFQAASRASSATEREALTKSLEQLLRALYGERPMRRTP